MPVDRFLTHTDRCDTRGCGARAYARAFFDIAGRRDPLPIDFCMHHWNSSSAAERSMYYIDETDYVLEAD